MLLWHNAHLTMYKSIASHLIGIIFLFQKSLGMSALERDSIRSSMCQNYGEGVHIDPFDCRRYHHCLAGESYVFYCYAGFVFDPRMKQCVFEQKCINRPSRREQKFGQLIATTVAAKQREAFNVDRLTTPATKASTFLVRVVFSRKDRPSKETTQGRSTEHKAVIDGDVEFVKQRTTRLDSTSTKATGSLGQKATRPTTLASPSSLRTSPSTFSASTTSIPVSSTDESSTAGDDGPATTMIPYADMWNVTSSTESSDSENENGDTTTEEDSFILLFNGTSIVRSNSTSFNEIDQQSSTDNAGNAALNDNSFTRTPAPATLVTVGVGSENSTIWISIPELNYTRVHPNATLIAVNGVNGSGVYPEGSFEESIIDSNEVDSDNDTFSLSGEDNNAGDLLVETSHGTTSTEAVSKTTLSLSSNIGDVNSESTDDNDNTTTIQTPLSTDEHTEAWFESYTVKDATTTKSQKSTTAISDSENSKLGADPKKPNEKEFAVEINPNSISESQNSGENVEEGLNPLNVANDEPKSAAKSTITASTPIGDLTDAGTSSTSQISTVQDSLPVKVFEGGQQIGHGGLEKFQLNRPEDPESLARINGDEAVHGTDLFNGTTEGEMDHCNTTVMCSCPLTPPRVRWPFGQSELDCGNLRCTNGGMYIGLSTGHCGCVCPLGYQGTQCQDVVDPGKCNCANGGRCVEVGEKVFACQCPIGYIGGQCQHRIGAIRTKSDNIIARRPSRIRQRQGSLESPPRLVPQELESFILCRDNTCSNGGLCLRNMNSGLRRCFCPENYTGPYCEQMSRELELFYQHRRA